jgi:hypothetical protein
VGVGTEEYVCAPQDSALPTLAHCGHLRERPGEGEDGGRQGTGPLAGSREGREAMESQEGQGSGSKEGQQGLTARSEAGTSQTGRGQCQGHGASWGVVPGKNFKLGTEQKESPRRLGVSWSGDWQWGWKGGLDTSSSGSSTGPGV